MIEVHASMFIISSRGIGLCGMMLPAMSYACYKLPLVPFLRTARPPASLVYSQLFSKTLEHLRYWLLAPSGLVTVVMDQVRNTKRRWIQYFVSASLSARTSMTARYRNSTQMPTAA